MASEWVPPQLQPMPKSFSASTKALTWAGVKCGLKTIEKMLEEPVKSRFQCSWPGQDGSAGWRMRSTSGRDPSQWATSSVEASSFSRRTARV